MRQLVVSISNTELPILEFALLCIGAGKLTHKSTSKANHSPSYAYAVWNRQALALLAQVEPYMRELVTTRNTLTPPREITLALVAGPFKTLDGRWTFQPIGADRGTRIELTIRFEFANPMLNLLLARSFEKSCNELVDAFVARARAVYGTR